MRLSYVFLLFSVLLAVVCAQDSSEESNIPKKTLRKYRVRRPITVDENGNPKPLDGATPRPGTRLRRIRIKQRPTEAPVAETTVAEVQPEEPQIAPQTQRQVVQSQRQQQQQQVFYEEQPQVLEQIRSVPQYRTVTSPERTSQLMAGLNLRTKQRESNNDRKSVGTTQNYSHINDDGSFTWGYEAEDGSFKEETRGIDCVVRGKYGYVDPDGVRREFSYVSGNACDPNEPNAEEPSQDDELDEKFPPARPLLRRVRPEVSQGLEQTAEEKLPEDQLPALFRVATRTRRPQQQQDNNNGVQPTTFRPRVRITATTAAPLTATSSPSDQPQVLQPFGRQRLRVNQEVDNNNALPQGRSLFNFNNEFQRLVQQPQGQVQYTPQVTHHTHGFPSRQVFGNVQPEPYQPTQFTSQIRPTAEALKVNQAGATLAQSQGSSSSSSNDETNSASVETPRFGNYHTELVYDRNTNQYTSRLVQDIPKTGEEFTLTQKLRGFVEPHNPNQFQISQFGTPSVQFFGNHPGQFQTGNPSHLQPAGFLPQPSSPFQGQASLPVRTLQFQNPQQQQQQQQQQPQPNIPSLHADAQQIQAQTHVFPQATQHSASGQIDSFLRSLNISV